MSSLTYREWDIFVSEHVREEGHVCSGHYECSVPAFLMTRQTLGFFAENFDLRLPKPIQLSQRLPPHIAEAILQQSGATPQVRIYGQFDPRRSSRDQIDEVVDYVNALAMSADFPLHVQSLQFVDAQQGTVLHASRRQIGRGVGFEIEQRGAAVSKTRDDFKYFHTSLLAHESRVKVAIRHYLTGMTLLALEDVAAGLLDAAYMQFYQGVEALIGEDAVEPAKKAVALRPLQSPRDAQIICHQVFAVRHKYFGHGSETDFHEIADAGPEEAFRVAKQCLVARWLCRALIDCDTPSRSLFSREMRLYGPGGASDEFRGTTWELERSFWVEFGQAAAVRPKQSCKIYDSRGVVVDTYMFPLAPMA